MSFGDMVAGFLRFSLHGRHSASVARWGQACPRLRHSILSRLSFATRGQIRDQECVQFLRWALPSLGLRWSGLRKVRRQVCKRISRRMQALGLANVRAYRSYLQANADEWPVLASMCRISIWSVFEYLAALILCRLAATAHAAGQSTLRCWSAGCASGEEPYTLALLWRLCLLPRFPDLNMHITATDCDAHLLKRAKRACYPASSVAG